MASVIVGCWLHLGGSEIVGRPVGKHLSAWIADSLRFAVCAQRAASAPSTVS